MHSEDAVQAVLPPSERSDMEKKARSALHSGTADMLVERWLYSEDRLRNVNHKLEGAGLRIDARDFLEYVAACESNRLSRVENIEAFLDARIEAMLKRLLDPTGHLGNQESHAEVDGESNKRRATKFMSSRREMRVKDSARVFGDHVLIQSTLITRGDVPRVAALVNYVNLIHASRDGGLRRRRLPTSLIPQPRKRRGTEQSAAWAALWLSGLRVFPNDKGKDPAAKRRTREINRLKSDFADLKTLLALEPSLDQQPS